MQVDVRVDFNKGDSFSTPARLVVVRDHYAQPIVVVKEMEDGAVAFYKAGDKEFEKVLKAFNIVKGKVQYSPVKVLEAP